MVEDFFVRRRLGGIRLAELGAREVEAFLILEGALGAERTSSAARQTARG